MLVSKIPVCRNDGLKAVIFSWVQKITIAEVLKLYHFGYVRWWGTYLMDILTQLEKLDFTGKK